ncbi:MAG: four helix bundle protein [Clostridia bacterium]|nr:four helix bundle protein [Clostridia bacterium]
MNDSPLLIKSKQFALKIIKNCDILYKQQKEFVLSNQLLRSGTSIGANIREAFYAQSKADFISKLSIALKECAESEYWLELLNESNRFFDSQLLKDCIELKKLLMSSINTTKQGM